MLTLTVQFHPLGSRSRLRGAHPRTAAGRLRSRLLARATPAGEEWDMGKPGKASPSFKDMRNPHESYDQDSFDQADEPKEQPTSAAEGGKDAPSSAPESGTERPSQESSQAYRANVASSQGVDQQDNPSAAPQSGDIRDETSGRGHV